MSLPENDTTWGFIWRFAVCALAALGLYFSARWLGQMGL